MKLFLFPVLAAALLTNCAGSRSVATRPGPGLLVYIGTNTGTDAQSRSIYLYRLNASNGALTPLGAQPGGANPTYLALDRVHDALYAVSETTTFQGQPGSGGVSAFSIDARTGALTLLNQQPSTGGSPCYISVAHGGQALVANYVGGNIAVLPLQDDGRLAPASATFQHQPPLGPHKNQDHAHAHCFLPDPAGRYAFAVDLGTDQVTSYRYDPAGRQYTPQPTPAFVAKPGAGPRHLTFHPNGRWAYLENELNSTVTALAYDAQTGTFREIETENQLPPGFTGENSGADVHVSPDGRFLYTSNRGDNSLAVFRIDGQTGALTLVEHVSTQGKTPRNFGLTPDGRLLLVANQNSGTVYSYFVDKATGRLRPTGQSAQVPSPMFVQFAPDGK